MLCCSCEPDKNLQHVMSISLTHEIKLGNFKTFRVESDIKQMGPGLLMITAKSSFGSFGVMVVISPIGPLTHQIRHFFFGPRSLSWLVKLAVITNSINFAEYIMIWNHKELVNIPIFTMEDKAVKQYRSWFSQFYSINSKNMIDARKDLSW